MTCRTCKHIKVPSTQTNKRYFARDGAYECLAPLPDLKTILPVSVTSNFGFRSVPHKTYMQPNDGEGCPAYVHWKKDVAPDAN